MFRLLTFFTKPLIYERISVRWNRFWFDSELLKWMMSVVIEWGRGVGHSFIVEQLRASLIDAHSFVRLIVVDSWLHLQRKKVKWPIITCCRERKCFLESYKPVCVIIHHGRAAEKPPLHWWRANQRGRQRCNLQANTRCWFR